IAFGFDRAHLINRLTDNVDYPSERGLSNRNRHGSAGIFSMHTSNHTVRWLQGDCTHAAFAEMLLHFNDHIDRNGYVESFARNVERLVDRRLLALFELDVDRRPDNL